MKINRKILSSILTLLYIVDASAACIDTNLFSISNKGRKRSWSEISLNNRNSNFDVSRSFSDNSDVSESSDVSEDSDISEEDSSLLKHKNFNSPLLKREENFYSDLYPKTVRWSDTWKQYKNDPFEGPAVISDVSLEFSPEDWNYILEITEDDKFPNLRSLKCNIFVGNDYEKKRDLIDTLSILFRIAPNLEELNLDDCFLETVPESITNLANLKKLSLANNKLETVPSFLENSTQLMELNLSYNSLYSFPPEIKNLTNLRSLQLVNTYIESVPKWISNLNNLEELDVSSNRLKFLPSEIWDLENLISLNISSNPFLLWEESKFRSMRKYFRSLLPFCLCKRSHLEDPTLVGNTWLTLRNKDLKYILRMDENTIFSNLERLEVSIFTNNKRKRRKLRKKLSSFLCNMPNLKELTLSCGSEDLPPEIYELEDLRKLNLSFNKLKALPSRIENLKNLVYLNLSNNELSGLPSKIGNLENLMILNVSNNRLMLLPLELEDLKNLVYVDTSNNPLLSNLSVKMEKLTTLRF